jgi:chemotaxis protein MotB
MALRRRGSSNEAMNPWPGYVDALSTLLMVIIFVLLVFVLAQAFLSVALSGRDRALDRVNRQMSELSDMLSLERGRSAEMRVSVAQQLANLRAEESKIATDRDALKSDRDRLSAQLADSNVQLQAAQARASSLQSQVAAV